MCIAFIGDNWLFVFTLPPNWRRTMKPEMMQLYRDLEALWNSEETGLTIGMVADRLGIANDDARAMVQKCRKNGVYMRDRRGRHANPEEKDFFAQLATETTTGDAGLTV
jgi:hypothetical protein